MKALNLIRLNQKISSLIFHFLLRLTNSYGKNFTSELLWKILKWGMRWCHAVIFPRNRTTLYKTTSDVQHSTYITFDMKHEIAHSTFHYRAMFLHGIMSRIRCEYARKCYEKFSFHTFVYSSDVNKSKKLSSWQFRSLPHCSWANQLFLLFHDEMNWKHLIDFVRSLVSFANEFFSNFHLDESCRRSDDGYLRLLCGIIVKCELFLTCKTNSPSSIKRQQQWPRWMSRRRLDFFFLH